MSHREINRTHDADAGSWVLSANGDDNFPLQNLPLAVFRTAPAESWRGGMAIGDRIVDLQRLASLNVLQGDALVACRACIHGHLDDYLALGPGAWRALRHGIFDALDANADAGTRERVSGALLPRAPAEFKIQTTLRNYTDFYTSIHHAANVGRLVRPDNPLTPNFEWLPLAYHGRASTVRIGQPGFAFRRPTGQSLGPQGMPVAGPCEKLDFELEVGFFIGRGNDMGTSIPLSEAESHIAGLVLLNDWSARDHQFWETAPLGPFSGKNFCTTISPWIVSAEALAPFRVPVRRPVPSISPLSYLSHPANDAAGAIDIQLEVAIETAEHRHRGLAPSRIARTTFAHQYWTLAQMVTQHTLGGCALLPGDLVGSGTVSGPTHEETGALVELSEGGRRPVTLEATGEQRSFLSDGDTVILRGWCEREGFARIGFGQCVGKVEAALATRAALPSMPRTSHHPESCNFVGSMD